MKPFALPLIATLLLGAAPVETPISTKDPHVFEPQLREMGYAPDPFVDAGTKSTSVLHLTGETLGIVLAGCKANRACRYVVVVGAFTDVLDPPADFVAKMNVDYDVIKVWVRDDRALTYSSGAIVEGMPRASFRAWIDTVVMSSNDLGAEALKAGLGPKNTQPATATPATAAKSNS